MLKRALPLGFLCLLAASCDATPPEPQSNRAAPAEEAPAPLTPPEPGQKGGLPDDGTPVSETPFTEKSAQGAAQVLQTYFALIEQGKYDEAWKLRWQGRGDDADSAEAFAKSFEQYAEYHASVGAPGDISGAAGSAYVDVPVQIYGRTRDGKPFATAGTVTLRRVNDVPGSSAEERRWRIYSRD
jgi:hypothetical protein